MRKNKAEELPDGSKYPIALAIGTAYSRNTCPDIFKVESQNIFLLR